MNISDKLGRLTPLAILTAVTLVSIGGIGIASHLITYEMDWTVTDFFVGDESITFTAIVGAVNETTDTETIGTLYPIDETVTFTLANTTGLTDFFDRYDVDIQLYHNSTDHKDHLITFDGTEIMGWEFTGLTPGADYTVNATVTYTLKDSVDSSQSTTVELIIED